VKAWKRPHVDALARSDTIPDLLERIQGRSEFTLEELHLFARRFEESLKMNFEWLYTKFPLSEGQQAEPVYQMTIGSRPVSLPGPVPRQISGEAAARPRSRSGGSAERTEASMDLPALLPFDETAYNEMMLFVHRSITNWNTLNYRRQ
jgi:hypothetical protein